MAATDSKTGTESETNLDELLVFVNSSQRRWVDSSIYEQGFEQKAFGRQIIQTPEIHAQQWVKLYEIVGSKRARAPSCTQKNFSVQHPFIRQRRTSKTKGVGRQDFSRARPRRNLHMFLLAPSTRRSK